MKRRTFLKGLGTGAIALACPAMGGPSSSGDKTRPNILFLFADDQTYEALHALGCNELQTPNLDRLVRSGTTFTHAYNQGAWHGAVCVASRTMLNTGRFLWHARDLEPNLKQETASGRFWSQYMDRAGYDTYMSGKWHVKGVNPQDIFDFVRDVRPGMPNQTPEGYNRPVKGEPDPWSPYERKFGGYWKGGRHWSEILGDHGVDFLEQAANRENPFFMYLAFNAPHDPRQSPKEYVDKYPPDELALPDNFAPEYPYKEDIGCGKRLRDERLAPFPRTPHAVKVHRQEYYAIITHMDAQIGRILDALERSHQADNTYIFFTADHGLAVGHHGLMGKQNMYDHSVRVPLVVGGPGIDENARITAPVYLQDIMPTTLELAGAAIPRHVQFKSLLPLLTGRREKSYEAIYGGYINLQRMITDDHFKLIYYPKIDKTLLFDLMADPLEEKNLADDPQYVSRVRKLKEKLRELQRECGDELEIH